MDFLRDPGKLPPEVVQEIGRVVKEPVYLCPCHNSTLRRRMARGWAVRRRAASIASGSPASRTAVEIGEVEEDVLIFC